MRRFILVLSTCLAVSVVVTALLLVLLRPSRREASPEVLDVGPSRITIAWRSEAPYVGRVFYVRAGHEGQPRSAEESFGASDRHEVVIKGLTAGARYSYWLEGSEARYQFRTQPGPAIPFRFLLVWGDVADRLASLMMSDPEFVLSLGPIPAAGPDRFAAVRPLVPVYGPDGACSSFARGPADPKPRTLDWGGLRLAFPVVGQGLRELLKTSPAHTTGVVAEAAAVGATGGQLKADDIRAGSLHALLAAHNQRSPSRPAAFVIVTGAGALNLDVDGIRYLGVDTSQAPGSLLVDVSPESTTALFTAENRRVELRRPPLRQKRTCEECRRLADRGAYEESVKAYQDFIKTHEGHYQVDDAYFAIAEIMDEKLFRYPEALSWYRKLLADYPRGALASLARGRIEFLSSHADHGYEPLARFERIRRVEFARLKHSPEGREKCLREVREIIRKFPDSSLAPLMYYWLANQYRAEDPDRAISLYRKLVEKFPRNPQAREVPLEIAETLYEAGRFRDSVDAYRQALRALPARTEEIEAQMGRAQRNLRRSRLAPVCWSVLTLIALLGILWPPRGLSARRFFWSMVALVSLSALLLVGGWLIHEQFSSPGELVALACGLAASACLGMPFSAGLAGKLVAPERAARPGRHLLAALLGGTINMLFLACGSYLSVYHVNEHYLVVIGL